VAALINLAFIVLVGSAVAAAGLMVVMFVAHVAGWGFRRVPLGRILIYSFLIIVALVAALIWHPTAGANPSKSPLASGAHDVRDVTAGTQRPE